MERWSEFAAEQPDMAEAGRTLLYQFRVGLGYLATVRKDGDHASIRCARSLPTAACMSSSAISRRKFMTSAAMGGSPCTPFRTPRWTTSFTCLDGQDASTRRRSARSSTRHTQPQAPSRAMTRCLSSGWSVRSMPSMGRGRAGRRCPPRGRASPRSRNTLPPNTALQGRWGHAPWWYGLADGRGERPAGRAVKAQPGTSSYAQPGCAAVSQRLRVLCRA
jgi:hypothetical protein